MNPSSSFHPHDNKEPLDSTNLDDMMENLNRSNQQLLQAIEELKAENLKLRLFINIAAHELRTPIMPIIGYSEILQEDIGQRKEIKGIKDVELYYEPKDIFLVADKVRLGRVISNLLHNAIKFTPHGEITIATTEIKHNNGGESIHVSIKDTGSGLSPAISPKLFSKFVSTDSGGTGLGLFVSKNIIESHGGKIEAQNNPDGKGALFSFIIPK